MGIANMIVLLTVVFSSASASAFSDREVVPLSQSQETSNCPEKWLDASFVDMGCLYFNITQDITWEDANSICQGSNSTLIDISTEMQMGFLQMELDVIANAEGTTHYWWTAGTDLGINGRWIWATTLTAVEDYVWIDSFPNAVTAYNCLALHPSYGYFGFNINCDAAYFPICQLK